MKKSLTWVPPSSRKVGELILDVFIFPLADSVLAIPVVSTAVSVFKACCRVASRPDKARRPGGEA